MCSSCCAFKTETQKRSMNSSRNILQRLSTLSRSSWEIGPGLKKSPRTCCSKSTASSTSMNPPPSFRPGCLRLRIIIVSTKWRKREYKVRLEPVDPQGEEREPHLPSPQAGPDKVLEGEEVAAKIREILLAIPDNQRTAILLSRQEGMSYQEVAAVIGCTHKAVKSLVFRATQSLKAGLRDMVDEDET